MASHERSVLIPYLKKFEIQCITGNFTNNDSFNISVDKFQSSKDFELLQDLDFIIKQIINHDYKKILERDFSCLRRFKEECKDFRFSFYERYGEMKSNYKFLFHPDDQDCPYVKQLILLLVGVSALQEFVKINIIGTCNESYKLISDLLPERHFSNYSILDALARNGEVVLPSVRQPKLLYLSLLLLFGNSFDKCLTHKWWLMRCMLAHQKTLPDTILSIHEALTSLITSQLQVDFLNGKEEPLAQFMFYVECAKVHLYYQEFNTAENFLVSAQNVLGIGLKFKIAFTRQSSKLPHFGFVTMKRNDRRYSSSVSNNNNSCAIKQFQREHCRGCLIKLVDSDNRKFSELLLEEQILLLAYCDYLASFNHTYLTQDEDQQILNYLLHKSDICAVLVKGLVLKAQKETEVSSIRAIIQQLKDIMDYVRETNFSLWQCFLYCASFPMSWELQKFYADTMRLKMELVNEALEVYEEESLWEDATSCYLSQIDLLRRGKRVLEEQIAIKPSCLLWCCLGDATTADDVETDLYNIAWELSNQSNARSKRQKGYHCMKNGQYSASVYLFLESLKVNHLQPKVLMSMGDIALTCGQLNEAILAFTHLLRMNSYNVHAWDGLTTAYIRKDETAKACRSLLEAQYFGAPSSANYILLCANIGAYSSVISCFHEMISSLNTDQQLSLNKSQLEALDILTNAIKHNVNDSDNRQSSLLKGKLFRLFRRMCSKTFPNGSVAVKVLKLYIDLLIADGQLPVRKVKKVIKLSEVLMRHGFANAGRSSPLLECELNDVLKFVQFINGYRHLREITGKTSTLMRQFLQTVLDIVEAKRLISLSMEMKAALFKIKNLIRKYERNEKYKRSLKL